MALISRTSAAASLVNLLVRIPGGVELHRNVEFGVGGDRPLLMHIARPKRPRRTADRPAVVYVFGGGWSSGDRDQGLLPIIMLAFKGYVAASIDYRLSQESIFPAQIEDCKCAVRFLRANAAKYGLRKDRIGAIGPSAGGHLSALLGTTAGAERLEGTGGWADESSDVQAVVDWYGPTDLLSMAQELKYEQSSSTAMAKLLGGPPVERQDIVDLANPIRYVSDSAPPFLLLHGTIDDIVPPSQSQMLDAALRAEGVESELRIFPGRGHGWLGWEAIRQSGAFLDWHLRKR